VISVAGIAIDKDRLFIARRKEGGDLGGKWEFPGGKVEEGEGDREALAREYEEEFGVAVSVGDLVGKASFEHHGRQFSLHAYQIDFLKKNFTLAEHTEWRWAALKEIESRDFAGSDRLLLPEIKSYLDGSSSGFEA
jgi:8-oxo-dGTP diphosphatase